jgi:hypothetical protein
VSHNFQFNLDPQPLIAQEKPISIADVYQHYHLPQNLQQHMLLTAAVGVLAVDHWQDSESQPNRELMITALLTHDMGNVIKFDLSNSLGSRLFQENQSRQYWQQLQQAFIDRYGKHADQANIKIMQELNLPQEAVALMQHHDFDNLSKVLVSDNWAEKIVFYGDLRLTPSGLASITNRIYDLKDRYRAVDPDWQQESLVTKRLEESLQLETQLNQATTIDLKQITKNQLQDLARKLKTYSLPINQHY